MTGARQAVTLTWWGHSTSTIELGGLRLLTDPLLLNRLGHLTRIGGPTPRREAADADVVLVSHLHADHLHVPSLLGLARTTRILAPVGAQRLLRRREPALAARIEELAPGHCLDIGAVRIQAVAAEHDGRRSPLSRHRGPALGFVLETGRCRLWFAGDTGLSASMSQLAPIDIALLPVGGWGPTLGKGHLDPAAAAQAASRAGARFVIPIHYATFWPLGLRHVMRGNFQNRFVQPGMLFAAELRQVAPDATAHVLGRGQAITIEVQA